MAIETASITIYDNGRSADERETKDLVEALADVAALRSMRDLYRYSSQHEIRCALRAPFLKNCAVQPRELGRTLRKVMRAAVDAANPGEQVLVDFLVQPDSRLVVAAGPAAELSGLDSAELDRLYATGQWSAR